MRKTWLLLQLLGAYSICRLNTLTLFSLLTLHTISDDIRPPLRSENNCEHSNVPIPATTKIISLCVTLSGKR